MQTESSSGAAVAATPAWQRLQEAAVNAWPALRQSLYHGWLLRFAPGLGHRSNCVVPLYPTDGFPTEAPVGDLLAQIRHCENVYAREQQPTAFRISTGAAQTAAIAELDPLLAERGYQQHNLTVVMTKNLHESDDASHTPTAHQAVQLQNLGQWLPLYCSLTGMQVPGMAVHQAILQGINGECAFATLYHANTPAACGMAVLDGDLVGLFDIFTDPDHRAKGFAETLINTLLAWGKTQRAEHAYLQVSADNRRAGRLYQRLGFSENHRFWYRLSG
ncbi:MAG: GNAT family N-acetyltransferase [Pseudomonadota bacterium]